MWVLKDKIGESTQVERNDEGNLGRQSCAKRSGDQIHISYLTDQVFRKKKKSFKLKSNGRLSFERYTVSRLFLEGLKSWAKELELHAVDNGKLLKVTE